MQIKIIQAGSAEYEQLIALRISTLLDPIGIPASYIDRKKEGNDIFIGGFDKTEIAGCCVLTKKDENVVQLRQMAVRKDLQGKRIGAAILEFAEAIAKQQGYKIVMIHARDAVIDFYKKCGYKISGEPFSEVGIGHHAMKKKLADDVKL